jgi:hypothetical protein
LHRFHDRRAAALPLAEHDDADRMHDLSFGIRLDPDRFNDASNMPRWAGCPVFPVGVASQHSHHLDPIAAPV